MRVEERDTVRLRGQRFAGPGIEIGTKQHVAGASALNIGLHRA